MQFLADENVSRLVVDGLRARGWDVARVSDKEPGAPDERVLGLARTELRILITEDQDFGDLVIRKRLIVGGVILLELDRLANEAEAERVFAVMSELGAEFRDLLTVIVPARVRAHPLPAPRGG